jgi:cytochrome c oxidase subunit II
MIRPSSLVRRLWAASVIALCSATGALAQDAATAPAQAPAMTDAAPGFVQLPHNWQIGFQAPGSPVQVRVEHLHTLIFWIITAITVFVAGLLAYVMWRFRASKNPQASRLSHHTWLEVTWTIAPALVLVVIAIPSFRLVYFENRTPNPDMTIKVTGHQWYWNYAYPDQDNVQFDSYMIADDELKPGQYRHLSVDNQIVVPVDKRIRILTTSADVIHSFFIPALGVQRYAIPGRVIETWVEVNKPGTYFGECNQICGTNHNVMPIEVRALSQPDFDAWVVDAKKKFSADAAPVSPGGAPGADGTRLAAVAR